MSGQAAASIKPSRSTNSRSFRRSVNQAQTQRSRRTIKEHAPQPACLPRLVLSPDGATSQREALRLAGAHHERRLTAGTPSRDAISAEELDQVFERILKQR